MLWILLVGAHGYFLETVRGLRECPAANVSTYEQWVNLRRRQEVREEFSFVWTKYVENALGFDSIRPVDGQGVNDWGGMNLFMIESLDTMHLMGFHDWFTEATDYVISHTDFGQNFTVSVFETTIRLLGGLLSAAELSQREELVEMATELGFRLVKAFRVNDTFPYPLANMGLGLFYYSPYLVLSEMTTLTLEFRKLSQMTHIQQFSTVVSRVESFFLRKLQEHQGVLRQLFSIKDHRFYGKYTMGGGTDSFYEYLYKSWLFSGGGDGNLRKTYEFSKKETVNKLKHTAKKGATFLREIDPDNLFSNHMEHLACFFPGLLSLENILEEYEPEEVALARQLLEACLEPARNMKTKLAPEAASWEGDRVKAKDLMRSNQLRPEVVESLFYMWRLTHNEVRGNQYYRDMAYGIFRAFRDHCKCQYGYSAVEDVDEIPATLTNDQPSYFTAEVLKYLYLLFGPVILT